MAFVAKMYCCF